MSLIAPFSSAQTLSEYLQLRKSNAISRATTVVELDQIVGSKIVEVRCRVTGKMEMDGLSALYVQFTTGEDQVIDSERLPDWLQSGSTVFRMLLKVSRDQEQAALKAEFIGAAPDSEIERIEIESKPKQKPTTNRESAKKPSRSASSRPVVYKGEQVVAIYADFIKNHNKKLPYSKAYEIATAVIGWSRRYEVDARLVMALLIAESDFRPDTFSHAGAAGLGQLMPETAKELGVRDRWNTNENLYGTVKLLRQHIDRYGANNMDYDRLALALAAYNAGPGAVKRHGGVPPYRETQKYVRKIISIYKQLCG
jgi:soluble lytic murein transglycosylase-like protein